MIIDARKYESLIGIRQGIQKERYMPLEFTRYGILLQLVDARTFGGVIRFSIDNKGREHVSGSSSQPMRIRNPFRFAEMSAYRITTPFELKQLPNDVLVQVIPTAQAAAEGFMIIPMFIDAGNIEFTAITVRKMEISPDYPIAELVFMDAATATDLDGIKSIKDESTNFSQSVSSSVKADNIDLSIDVNMDDEFDDSFLDEPDDSDIDYQLEDEMPVEFIDPPKSDAKAASTKKAPAKSRKRTTTAKKTTKTEKK